jgi:hypothetical protein
MRTRATRELPQAPATKGWSRTRVLWSPRRPARRHLRVLPTRTRPSLFGGD